MDDIGQLLIDSLEAIHRQNTRRPIHCKLCFGLVFLTADDLLRHQASRHGHHPARGGGAA